MRWPVLILASVLTLVVSVLGVAQAQVLNEPVRPALPMSSAPLDYRVAALPDSSLLTTPTIGIDYTISITQPQSHTMHVRINIIGLQQSPLELTLHESVAANDIVSNAPGNFRSDFR